MSEVSDSSDDDVCFGPYTIKEAKRDWQKYAGKKVDRRHSTACVTTKLKNPVEIPNILNGVDEISTSTSNSKCASEYLTPNDTMFSARSSQNSEFLEKIKQVIDEPSQASSYATALNHTSNQYQDSADTTNLDSIYVTLVENTRCIQDLEDDVNENSKEIYQSCKQFNENGKEISEDSVITISDESQSHSESSFCAIEPKTNVNVFSSPLMLSEEYKYDEPVSTSNHDFSTNENEAEQSSLGITSLNLSDTEQKPKDYSCNIIMEDSLESFEEECKTDKTSDIETNPVKYSYDMHIQGSLLNSKEQDNYSEETDVYSNNLFSSYSNNKYGRVIVDCNQLSKISEKTEFNSCIDGSVEIKQKLPFQSEANSNNYDSMSQNSQINRVESHCLEYDIFNNSSKTTASSPVQVPTKNDDSYQFDDTLEEINNFLAQGEDYIMPEVTLSKCTPNSKQRASEIISASFLNKSNPSNKLENKTPNFKSPFESKIKPPSVVSGRLFNKPQDKQDFKVPIKPVKKITTPSKLHTNPCLKNVVSPVGVYIKNSPKYCPLLKANKMNTPQTKKIGRDKTPMKENIPSTSNMELPMVIYRPAKNKHTIDDERLKLPENIKKLVGAQSIIKHEERIQVADCNESIERRLMESDFSIDASCCNDISILTNKQPFKT